MLALGHPPSSACSLWTFPLLLLPPPLLWLLKSQGALGLQVVGANMHYLPLLLTAKVNLCAKTLACSTSGNRQKYHSMLCSCTENCTNITAKSSDPGGYLHLEMAASTAEVCVVSLPWVEGLAWIYAVFWCGRIRTESTCIKGLSLGPTNSDHKRSW